MTKLQEFLDQKHGAFIGRVYMLVVLFLGNACAVGGASLYFTFGRSPLLMICGVIVTVASIAVLSQPTHVDSGTRSDREKELEEKTP